MIQINLIPDVKREWLKAEQTKYLVTSLSVIISAVSLLIFVPLFLMVHVVQAHSMSNIDADLKTRVASLNNIPNLGRILTVQSQLTSLPSLHDQKAAASRLPGFLGQVTPSQVTISNISTDFGAHTMNISGDAPSLDIVNTFVDTLKFTTYTTDASKNPTKAFSSVVLAGFSRTPTGATYNITLNYDPAIFTITNKTTLTVPKTVTTRSVTQQPNALFKEDKNPKTTTTTDTTTTTTTGTGAN